jgi:MinD-like ATPase involved in chromosome partitioning or flagellar assembly
MLDQHLGRAFEGLMVLPAPTDPERMARLDEHSYRRVIERLQSLVGILVLDCGTGLQEPAARAAQATADQIILVSDAQPATASLVAEAAGLLSTVGPPLTLVVNKMPASAKEARIDLEGLEELVPDAHGLVMIEDDERRAARGGRRLRVDRRARAVAALAARARGRARGGLAGARTRPLVDH